MYTSVLLPLDLNHKGSWESALPAALDIAEKYGAHLHLVSIVPNVSMSIISQYLPENFEKTAIKEAGAALREFAAQNAGGNVKTSCHVAHGVVREEIVKAADRLRCSLIVMAPHRPETLDILISPKTDYVVRHFKGSVLVVRG